MEGAGSQEEIRSVCSCTFNSCNPFQQINRRQIDINPLDQDDNEFQTLKGSMRWYSTEALRTTSPGRGMTIAPSTPEHEQKQLVWTAKKAISVHDLAVATSLEGHFEPTSPNSMQNEILANSNIMNRLLPPTTPVSYMSSKSGETMSISKDPLSTNSAYKGNGDECQDMDEDSLEGSLYKSAHVLSSSNRPDSSSSQNNNTWRFISSFRKSARKILPHRHKPTPTTCNESYALDEINSIRLMSLQNVDDNHRVPL